LSPSLFKHGDLMKGGHKPVFLMIIKSAFDMRKKCADATPTKAFLRISLFKILP